MWNFISSYYRNMIRTFYSLNNFPPKLILWSKPKSSTPIISPLFPKDFHVKLFLYKLFPPQHLVTYTMFALIILQKVALFTNSFCAYYLVNISLFTNSSSPIIKEYQRRKWILWFCAKILTDLGTKVCRTLLLLEIQNI